MDRNAVTLVRWTLVAAADVVACTGPKHKIKTDGSSNDNNLQENFHLLIGPPPSSIRPSLLPYEKYLKIFNQSF
jgi:hypothetical protein